MSGDEETDESLKECNICGSEIEDDADYCPECGADFTRDYRYTY